MICLVRALFAPRLASRALSVLNNNQGMRSRRARLLARVAAPNRSHTLAWHASDRGPRFSLSRAGELGSSLHRQGDELVFERCMASRRGSRPFWPWPSRRVAAKPLMLACTSRRLALPTQSTSRAAIYVHRHRFTARHIAECICYTARCKTLVPTVHSKTALLHLDTNSTHHT